MESSETNKIYHSEPMFILNRNGKTREEIWDIFEETLKKDYSDSDVEVTWVSIFGKYPELPHVFIILSSNSIMDELKENGTLEYGPDEIFDISPAVPVEAVSVPGNRTKG